MSALCYASTSALCVPAAAPSSDALILPAGTGVQLRDGDVVTFGNDSVARVEVRAAPCTPARPPARPRAAAPADLRSDCFAQQLLDLPPKESTLEDFLEAECGRLEQRVRVRAGLRAVRARHALGWSVCRALPRQPVRQHSAAALLCRIERAPLRSNCEAPGSRRSAR